MAPFEIHPQLLRDAYRLGKFRLCHLLLHKNAVLPWFILVPETEIADLLDLPDDLRAIAIHEAARISEIIKQELGYPKVNFAGIGNVVPQLHLHVVGRRPDDPSWPAPVWGNLRETREYSAAELHHITQLLQRYSPTEFITR